MRSWLTALLLIGACDDFEPRPDVNPHGDTGEVNTLCPAGMSQASVASLAMTNFAETGTPLTTDFNAGADYGDYAPACISSDGLDFRFVFTVGGAPYGSITVSHAGEGSYELAGDAEVQLDLFGSEAPLVYGGSAWQSGSLSIENNDGLLEAALFGLGYVEANSVTIDAQMSIAP